MIRDMTWIEWLAVVAIVAIVGLLIAGTATKIRAGQRVFGVVCTSGENILWRADDVTSIWQNGPRFFFVSKSKGNVQVGNAACVITEVTP